MVDSSRRINRHSGPGDETNFRAYGHCLEYPEIFLTDRFDVGRSIPPIPQLIGRKRRAGARVVTGADVERNVRREGALWGTPRKRTLFGPEGHNSISSGSDVTEARSGWPPDDEYVTEAQSGWPPEDEYPEVAQSGWPPEDEYLEETRSPRVELYDVVARLQKELEEFRAESGYSIARRSAIPAQTSGGSGFTSTSVPMYAGKFNWDQYRHVFEAIVCSNGCDGVTAALQLVSHLEGDALNVALLVPASERVLPGVLVGALSENYGSPGRLAEYSRQFERTSRSPGDDPSVFAIELETLARKAFADVDASVCLQLVRDRFIAGQVECSLRRHLDSVGPDTPMRDIVDSCRVWESHAEDTDSWESLTQPGTTSGSLPSGGWKYGQ